MVASQNGWRTLNYGDTDNRAFPGTSVVPLPGVRRGDVATVLHYLGARFHREVEPLVKGWSWGFAPRPVRGGSSVSNHASGTAVDLNAPEHPLGKRGTFSANQVRAIRRILADLDGTVRWGGDYRTRADEMHFEIVGDAGAVARVARRINTPPAPKPPAPQPPRSEDVDEKDIEAIAERVVHKLLNSDVSGLEGHQPLKDVLSQMWTTVTGRRA